MSIDGVETTFQDSFASGAHENDQKFIEKAKPAARIREYKQKSDILCRQMFATLKKETDKYPPHEYQLLRKIHDVFVTHEPSRTGLVFRSFFYDMQRAIHSLDGKERANCRLALLRSMKGLQRSHDVANCSLKGFLVFNQDAPEEWSDILAYRGAHGSRYDKFMGLAKSMEKVRENDVSERIKSALRELADKNHRIATAHVVIRDVRRSYRYREVNERDRKALFKSRVKEELFPQNEGVYDAIAHFLEKNSDFDGYIPPQPLERNGLRCVLVRHSTGKQLFVRCRVLFPYSDSWHQSAAICGDGGTSSKKAFQTDGPLYPRIDVYFNPNTKGDEEYDILEKYIHEKNKLIFPTLMPGLGKKLEQIAAQLGPNGQQIGVNLSNLIRIEPNVDFRDVVRRSRSVYFRRRELKSRKEGGNAQNGPCRAFSLEKRQISFAKSRRMRVQNGDLSTKNTGAGKSGVSFAKLLKGTRGSRVWCSYGRNRGRLSHLAVCLFTAAFWQLMHCAE